MMQHQNRQFMLLGTWSILLVYCAAVVFTLTDGAATAVPVAAFQCHHHHHNSLWNNVQERGQRHQQQLHRYLHETRCNDNDNNNQKIDSSGQRRRRVPRWVLFDASSASSSTNTAAASPSRVRAQLGLEDQFVRWRFLQNLLDGDVTPETTVLVLVALLDSFLLLPIPPGSDSPSPVRLSDEQRSIVQDLKVQSSLYVRTLRNLGRQHGGTWDGDGEEEDINNEISNEIEIGVLLERLERLLPYPDDDEDAVKSLWDVVAELHGQEAVKYNERNGTVLWKARCSIARVLLHYDFLADGIKG
jgi:hypothetical protein